MLETRTRPFLIQSSRHLMKEHDIIDLLQFLQEIGYRGRMQLIDFSILLQTSYDIIELIKISFPDYIDCKEVEFLDDIVH